MIRVPKTHKPRDPIFDRENWIRHGIDALQRERAIERKMRLVPIWSDMWWRYLAKLDDVRTERIRERLFEAVELVEAYHASKSAKRPKSFDFAEPTKDLRTGPSWRGE